MPAVGERYQEPDMVLANEWTGDAWTSVCPDDEVALTARDEGGWLICPVCRRRHNDLAEQARREQQ
jgi:hypothetical protein